eukprot:1192689-Prorocentrum_minimum.AAC.2
MMMMMLVVVVEIFSLPFCDRFLIWVGETKPPMAAPTPRKGQPAKKPNTPPAIVALTIGAVLPVGHVAVARATGCGGCTTGSVSFLPDLRYTTHELTHMPPMLRTRAPPVPKTRGNTG